MGLGLVWEMIDKVDIKRRTQSGQCVEETNKNTVEEESNSKSVEVYAQKMEGTIGVETKRSCASLTRTSAIRSRSTNDRR